MGVGNPCLQGEVLHLVLVLVTGIRVLARDGDGEWSELAFLSALCDHTFASCSLISLSQPQMAAALSSSSAGLDMRATKPHSLLVSGYRDGFPSRLSCKPLSRLCALNAVTDQAAGEASTQPPLSLNPIPRTQAIISNSDTFKKKKTEGPAITPEKLEDWLMDCIGEIVRNLREAPLLIHLRFSGSQEEGCSSPTVKMEREQARESWLGIKRRWKRENSTPDAVILVEELKRQTGAVPGDEATSSSDDKTWGVLVQGRGLGIDSATCYVLSTSKVCSFMGCCTHFYLVKAQSFDEPYWIQLRNAWLLR